MSDYLIDLAKSPFWLTLALAVLLLAPMARNQHRSWVYALLNLGFIGTLVGSATGWRGGWLAAGYTFGGCVIAWLLAMAIRGAPVAEAEMPDQPLATEPPFAPGGADGPGVGDHSTGELSTAAVAAPAEVKSVPPVRKFPTEYVCVVVALGLTMGLFLLHKLPWLSVDLHIEAINPLLKVTAYSYISLRLIELFRAMYEKRHEAPNLISTINYLLPFQMIAAGPIQGYDDFVSQPAQPRPLSADTALAASFRIAFGLFKKFVLAFLVQKTFLTGFKAPGIYWLIEAQFFFIWLYLDFSAYSDIAVGIGQLIGVATPENFKRPFFARNMIVFWERWHISLSLWIRRNLFFPTQVNLLRWTGGRNPMMCAAVGFLVSFLLCGMWHGIAWNFLVWGIMHSSGLIIVNLYRQYLTKKLGTKGVKAYLANPYYRALAIATTFEWVALSHLTFFYRF